MQSQTVTATLSKSRPDTSANLALAPSTEGEGSVTLTIKWDANNGIGYCKYTFLGQSTAFSVSGTSFLIQSDSAPVGIHELKLSFYRSSSSTIPLYECTEYIAVYPELTTNTWTKQTAPHIDSDGNFKVTQACVQTFVYRKIYVSSSGNDTGANGTSERPFATIKAAMARIEELAPTSIRTINESTPWELHVIGEIKANSNSDLADSFYFVNVNGTKIQHLAIVGEGSGAKINANEKATVLHVYNGAQVSMENITLTKGSGVSGGGVSIDNGTFTIKSGSITGNKASSFGGGVYIGSGGTLNMNGGSITGNDSSDKGGGIYAYGNFTGSSTTIKTNTTTNYGNNIFINSTCTSTVPDGDNAFYNDTTTTNGKSDAVCLIATKQFARFNNPATGSGTTNFHSLVKSSNGVFDTTKETTLYLGNSNDSTAKTWKASETIVPAGVATIASASSTKHTITIDGNVTNLVETTKNFTLKKTTLQGNDNTRCIWCKNGTVTMEDSTLKGGGATPGAGIYIAAPASGNTPEAIIDENSTVEGCDNSSKSGAMGGGIFVDKGSGSSATLTLSGTVSGCTSKSGGGIYLQNGTVTLKDNAVVGKTVSASSYASNSSDGSNKATDNTLGGGGVYVYNGTFNMEGSSKISYNYAPYQGGGIYVAGGTVNIGDSGNSSPSVCNNCSEYVCAGAIYATGGIVNLYGNIKYNFCNNGCGGVQLAGGKLNTYSGSVISNNTTAIAASGHHGCGVVINDTSSTLYMYGGSITGNKTSSNNTTYDVSIETDGSLKMEGNANAGKVCKKLTEGFIWAKDLTATPAATITPVNGFGGSSTPQFDSAHQIVYQLGATSDLAAACKKFTLSPRTYGGYYWRLNDDGKLYSALLNIDSITHSDSQAETSYMVNGDIGAGNLVNKIILYKTSNGQYGLMQFTSFPSTFYWKTGNGNKQTKTGFQSGWGFDLDGASTNNSNKDFGIDSGKLHAYNGATFLVLD